MIVLLVVGRGDNDTRVVVDIVVGVVVDVGVVDVYVEVVVRD